MTDKSPIDEIKTLVVELKTATDAVMKNGETAQTEIKNLGKMTEETKAAADKNLAEMNGLSLRITDLEQKIARRGAGSDPTEQKTIGQTFIENDQVKALLDSTSKRGQVSVSMERRNITSGTGTVGSGVSPSTSLVVADRQALVSLPDRRMTVRDLITPGTTSSSSIEYPQEVSFTNSAATVAEAASKPQSDVTFNLVQTGVKTVAHFMKASRQIMDDAPMLQSYIDGRLRYGLQYVEELQLLLGDGTGQNLLGLIPQATAYSSAFTVTGETDIDRLRLASLQATLALYPSTGYVLHPTDWAKIEMQKDSMGRYIVGDPQGQVQPRLWGLPVVETQAQPVTTFLTGAFKLGAQIFDRMQMEVLLSTEDGNNFTQNMITIRGEERLALAVYRPGAFVTGSLPQ